MLLVRFIYLVQGLFSEKVPSALINKYLESQWYLNFVSVGKPIEIEKVENPSEQLIEQKHALFKEKLKELFDEEKKNYLQDPNTELIIT